MTLCPTLHYTPGKTKKKYLGPAEIYDIADLDVVLPYNVRRATSLYERVGQGLRGVTVDFDSVEDILPFSNLIVIVRMSSFHKHFQRTSSMSNPVSRR